MLFKHFDKTVSSIATATLLMAGAFTLQAASNTPKPAGNSKEAATLLRDVKNDAAHVQSVAAHLKDLTAASGAKWTDYDRQWNEIKPSVEDMHEKMWRLENIRAQMTPAEQKEYDQSKPLFQKIEARTHELRQLLDKPGVRTTNSKFKSYANGISSEATKLEHTASAS
jgi:hypothetical protein